MVSFAGEVKTWNRASRLVLLCLLAAWPASAFCAGGKDLLFNGGFEDGLSGWSRAKGQEIVTLEGAPHSGQACLSGEIAEPNTFLILRRNVPVEEGKAYRLELWARATHGTRLTLFVVQPGGGKTKQSIGQFKSVPALWKRFEVSFKAEKTGDLELQIVGPNSNGAPAGRMWFDDISLSEYTAPAATSVSEGQGFNDEPSMARADDGSFYLAWNSFRDGADSLQVARWQLANGAFKRLGAWQVLGGKGTYVLGPRVVAAGPNAFVLYAAEQNGKWDVCAVPCAPEGPGKPIALTSDAPVDVKPAGAWRDGTLWVAWESNRDGGRRIYAASMRDGAVSKPEPLSADGCSNYSPSVAALPGGQVAVAWHSFRENNDDVYMRRRSGEGQWNAERRLTQAPSIDRAPMLFERGGELWIAYENALMSEYRIGGASLKRIIVARVTPDGLEASRDLAKQAPPFHGGEAPAPYADASGRIWLAYLRAMERSWSLSLTGFSGQSWEPLAPLSNMHCMDRRPALVVDGDQAIVAFQADDMPPRYENEEQSAQSHSDIYLTTLDLKGSTPATTPDLERFAEPADKFGPAECRVAYGEDTPTPSIDFNGKTLKLYYGDLHDHTEVSICNRTGDESIDESYQNMRDIAHLDFACVTDHGYDETPYLWYFTGKMARVNTDPSRFVAFLAEEWTSTFEEYSDKYPYGFYGHRNLIFADPYFPRFWNEMNGQTPADVWKDLRAMNANFIHIPHQLADTGNVPTDWSFHDEVAQPVAEIYQGRGSYEYLGAPGQAKRATPEQGHFIQDAWAKGLVIGVIASPDHGGGKGKACVFAPDFSREALLDAMRARHCFGTTAARIFLDVRVNGALMGDILPPAQGKPVEVKIRVRCPGDIDRVEVCRNNEFIYCNQPEGKEAELTFVDPKPLDTWSYYYVRVIQKDAQMAWSSPVWLGHPKPIESAS